MTIDKFEFYHGAVLSKLMNSGEEISVKSFPTTSLCTYSLNNNKVGIYIKYSQKRMTPWRFTFKKVHQEELKIVSEMHDKTFLVLVCGDDGVGCIEYEKLKKVLDENYDAVEWVKLHRFRRESYEFSGSNGKLKHKLQKSSFPNLILKALK